VCNGFAIPVSKNCHHALNQLRKRRRYRRQPLYVDAACIDQVSVTERNYQVAAMGDIYSAADRVVCWFGEQRFGIGAIAAYLLMRLSPSVYYGLNFGTYRYKI
jgi:hypothetical protein